MKSFGKYLEEKNKGLWHNIHAKRKRGEKMRKPGEEGAPTDADFKRSQNESWGDKMPKSERPGWVKDPKTGKWVKPTQVKKEETKLDEVSTDKLRDYASAALQDKNKAKADKRWKYAGKAMQKVADRDVKAKHDLKYNKTEAVEEKTLTPAEKKKREEIAKAMERDNPGMDMKKKMAIATWQAKKVAEEAIEESITKMSSARLKFHATKGVPHGSYTRKEVEDEHKRRMKTEPLYHQVKPSLNEETEELDEISRDLARHYIRKATADNKERRSDVMKPFPMKDMDKNVSQYKKMKSREKGIETAGKKAYDVGGKAKVPARESVELEEGLYHVEYGRSGKLTHQVVAKDAKDAHQKAMAHLKKKNPKLAHPDYADTFNKPSITHVKGNEPRSDKYKTEATEIDEISLSHLSNTIAKSTGTKNVKAAMKPGEVKKGLDDLRKRLETLGKQPQKEAVMSADKKPEKFVKPDGTVGVRMVRTNKNVIKKDA